MYFIAFFKNSPVYDSFTLIISMIVNNANAYSDIIKE